MRLAFFFLSLGVLVGCQSGGSSGAAPARAASPALASPVRMQNIIFFGNSLTAGYQLPASAAFPSLLQARIDSLQLPYKALNYGVSGETTAGGRQRVASVLARQPVDVFVLELGANDGLRGIPVRETTQNLQAIIDQVRLKYPRARIVLVGLEFPFDLSAFGGHKYGHYAAEFKALFRELADKNSLDFVPFLLQGVLGRRELNLPDGVHPNAEGQKILANNVWAVLSGVLGN
ncbi:acyl-CoA thioesterase-1 [Hymenobacter daecheongensis DSM 21074]|uniref:Acyl-CoA thioesterase-1 n=1 Tax=Hymenobacter daecheongensis DSM 21074 TaxID=1121955 RepID=A0A1M6BCT7_9BACT|nr:arylesterase [Hymenobacter daecheongensis]SHI46542.1 acyl-CoA thioesterase-1 [Hymenobacter daecheongensis DSM 21074]